jgi:hypothetical protein
MAPKDRAGCMMTATGSSHGMVQSATMNVKRFLGRKRCLDESLCSDKILHYKPFQTQPDAIIFGDSIFVHETDVGRLIADQRTSFHDTVIRLTIIAHKIETITLDSGSSELGHTVIPRLVLE